MKKKGHPPYQDILFVDTANGSKFVCGSTLQPKETEVYEGKEYPVYKISTSSASHPFFTGSQQLVDAEGRVSKFQSRYQQKRAQMQQQSAQQQQQKEEQAKEDPKKKGRAKKSAS